MRQRDINRQKELADWVIAEMATWPSDLPRTWVAAETQRLLTEHRHLTFELALVAAYTTMVVENQYMN